MHYKLCIKKWKAALSFIICHLSFSPARAQGRRPYMALSFIIYHLLFSPVGAQGQEHRLWYQRPATHWLEALPVGNSHMGAMVYGGTDNEEIQLNEETFWSGSPHNNNSPEAKEHLQEVRNLIFEGREEAAHALLDQFFFKGPHGMRFLPLGSVKLKFGHTDVSDYRRELNLASALASTSYIYKGVRYERTVFASQTDSVIIVRLQAGRKGALSFDLNFASPLQAKVSAVTSHEGIQTPVYELAAVVNGVDHEGVKAGLKAECRVLVKADGRVGVGADQLSVTDATVATLYISAATNFVNYHDVSGDPVKKNNCRMASPSRRTQTIR